MHYVEILQVAGAAWDKIKPPEDPSFDQCTITHRDNLVAQTEAVVRTRSASNPFEREVLGILQAKAVEASATSAQSDKPKRSRRAKANAEPAKATDQATAMAATSQSTQAASFALPIGGANQKRTVKTTVSAKGGTKTKAKAAKRGK